MSGYHVPESYGPESHGPRVLRSRVSGFRAPGPGSQVLILDYAKKGYDKYDIFFPRNVVNSLLNLIL